MSEPGTFKTLRNNASYFLSGGDLFFLVEEQHFRVHKYFFERESQYFRDRLTKPATPGNAPPGLSQDSEIVLEDVSLKDFERFLWVFYNPKYSLYDATEEDWTAILDLAHHWGFAQVKDFAIRELEKKLDIPVVDRLVIYQYYEVDKALLLPYYEALCLRDEPLSYEEGSALEMRTTINIAAAREFARFSVSENGTRQPTTANREELEGLLREMFDIGLEQAHHDGNTSGGLVISSSYLHQNQNQNQTIRGRRATRR
ncbi:hypothetical protein C8J56DRAFT_421270 [Mycena floridula]|nr:hypothetical protein C8J56DRAFT_421270 [Mycena floridula]